MLKNNRISRRKFLRNSAAGILPFGLGLTHYAKLHAASKNYSISNFPKETP